MAEAPIVGTGGFTINAVENQSFTAAVATFIDTGGPENPNDPGDYSATINWGDGSEASAGTITLSGQTFTVSGSHTYTGTGTFTITVDIVHETVSATVTSTANVPGGIISAQGGFALNAVEGQTFTATVATFTGTASKAVINWGDGTTSLGTISAPNGSGVCTVTGSHAYAEESNDFHDGNPYTITVTLYDSTPVSVTDTALVAEAPIVGTGGFTINAVEGQSFTAAVATFVDTGGPENPNNSGDYSATINWGDGTAASAGTITLSGQTFSVSGSHTFTGTGTFTITVNIIHETVSATVTSTANVPGGIISPEGGFALNAVEGQSFTATVATFRGTASKAVINWGDGTTLLGTISAPNGSGVCTVTGTHAYAEESNDFHGGNPYPITVTLFNSTPVSVTDTALVAEAPLSATGGFSISAVEGQSFTAAVATFIDTGGAETTPTISANYSATINWGDGSAASTGTITLSGQTFTVSGSHTYTGTGTFTITVDIVHETVSATVTSTANVPGGILSAEGGFAISAVEGQSFTATVATFTGTASKAVINWGDGTTSLGTISAPNGSGVCTVTGTHAYAEESNDFHGGNPYPITVTLFNSTPVSVTDTALVAEAPISATGGFSISAVEGQSFTAAVATFIDTGGAETTPTISANYSATINWGDGSAASTGTITLSGQTFTVSGSHTYTGTGTFTITVDIVHETVSATVTSTANVPGGILSAEGGFAISAVEGQSFTATVATFTGTASKAVINWGDGTTSLGTITPNGNGASTVTGSHAYAEEGNSIHGGTPFTITVTLYNSTPVSVTDTANVAEAPISATGGFTISAVENQSFTAAVATFIDTGGPENPNDPGDYSATINWGDGTAASTGTITLSSQTFTVSGSHTYSGSGTFIITVNITHETVSATATSAAIVTPDAPSATGGLTLAAVEGQSFTTTVATFTDGQSPASEFTAAIDWGDGTTSTGTISGPDQNGVFSVTGTHTYAEESNPDNGGPFTITVTVSNNAAVNVTDTVNVADAPLSPTSGAPVTAVEGQSFTTAVATFTDTGGAENATQDYSATIDWGDGTTSTGTISGPDQNGVFSVAGTQTYAEAGSYTITVTLTHDTAPAVTVSESATVSDALLSAASATVTATQGTAFTGPVATFTDANPNPNINDFSATITWGDGNSSVGTITQNADGSFSVSGTDTYQSAGPFTVTVVINDVGGSTATATSTANVTPADLPLTATGLSITAVPFQGQDQTVASFIDADPTAVVGNFVATIDWGDGTQVDTGNITQPGGPGTPFFVDFMHSYNNAGTFTVHVHILDTGGLTDSGGAFADAFSTATVVGGGGASLASQGLTGTNGLHALQAPPAQQVTPVPVMTSHAPTSNPSSTASNDLYWALYASRGEQITGSSPWSAGDFSLVGQGMNV